MNRIILLLPLLASVGTVAQAQVRLGVKAGATLATFNNVQVTGRDWAMGLQGGVTLNAPITSDGFFSLQPELLYSEKGCRIENVLQSRLKYVDLPVLARFNASGFIFEAGPQLGYLVGGTQKSYAYTNGQITDSRIVQGTSGLHRFDVGYVAGVGYQLRSGPNIGLRYNGGLTQVPDNGSTVSVRNSVFQLFVGYVFGGKN